MSRERRATTIYVVALVGLLILSGFVPGWTGVYL